MFIYTTFELDGFGENSGEILQIWPISDVRQNINLFLRFALDLISMQFLFDFDKICNKV